METYQTKLYELTPTNDTGRGLFQSPELDNPAAAMNAFKKFPIPTNGWMGSLVTREDGKVLDEEFFDSSIEID